MRLNRIFLKTGAAMASIVLSMYLWNYSRSDSQFWTLNMVDLIFTATALAIPIRETKAKLNVHEILRRLHNSAAIDGLNSRHGRAA
jgi:hypothetical protein